MEECDVPSQSFESKKPSNLLENAIFQLSELKWNVKACLRRRQRNILKIAHGKAKKGINGWHEANEASESKDSYLYNIHLYILI